MVQKVKYCKTVLPQNFYLITLSIKELNTNIIIIINNQTGHNDFLFHKNKLTVLRHKSAYLRTNRQSSCDRLLSLEHVFF